jgi:hypothetical protein
MGGLAPDQGRFIGRGNDHDAAFEALLAEIVLDEFTGLTPALADQADNTDIRIGVARHH